MEKFMSVLLCFAMVVITVAAPMTFEQLHFKASDSSQLKQLKSAKLVYKVTSENEPPANLMIRFQRPGQLRIDVTSMNKAYTVCQNGKKNWGYSKEDGIYTLTKDELAELRYDADFLPIAVNDSPAFSDPVAKGEEAVDEIPCLRYESHSLIDPKVSLLLWVEKETNLLLKVEATDDESKTVTLFSNYQDIKGVKIATLIYIADTTGYYKMRLQSATWNPVFSAQLFSKPANVSQVKAEATKTPETFSSAKQPRQVTTQQKIGSLKKKIAKLKVLVKNDEEKLARMEKLIHRDRKQATYLTSGYTNCNIWSRRGFFIQRRRASVDLNRRRMANKLSQEAEEAMREYTRLNRQLVRHRIQLSKAEVDLEMLNAK